MTDKDTELGIRQTCIKQPWGKDENLKLRWDQRMRVDHETMEKALPQLFLLLTSPKISSPYVRYISDWEVIRCINVLAVRS